MLPAIAAVVVALATSLDPGESKLTVSVEWTDVSDALIRRCSLAGLENLLLQRLVESGFAVVDHVDDRGVAVRIREAGERVLVEGTFADRVLRRAVQVPRRCDSSLQLEILYGLLALLDDLQRPAVAPLRSPTTSTGIAEPQSSDVASRWSLGLGVTAPGSVNLLGSARVGWGWDLAPGAAAVLVAGANGTRSRDLLVAEPSVGCRILGRWSPGQTVGLRAGLGLAGILHLFTGRGRAGAHADGRLEVPLQLWVTDLPVGLEVVPYARAVQFIHETPTRTLFVSRHLGISVGLVVGASG